MGLLRLDLDGSPAVEVLALLDRARLVFDTAQVGYRIASGLPSCSAMRTASTERFCVHNAPAQA